MQKKIIIEINDQSITTARDLTIARLSKSQRKRLAKIFNELFEEERAHYVKILEQGEDLIDELIQAIEKPMLFGFAEYQKATEENTYDLGDTLRVRRKLILQKTNNAPAYKEQISDEYKVTREEHRFTPYNVLCITSEDKDKSKTIYTIDEPVKNSMEIKCFIYNANYSMEQLCSKIDRLNLRLVQVSKDAIVNVKYFELNDNTEYKCNIKIARNTFPKLMYSKTFGKSDYIKVLQNYKMQLSLPEKLFAYRSLLLAMLEK